MFANDFLLVFLLIVLGAVYAVVASSRTEHLPPGPKRLPILGNLLNAPKGPSPWVTFAEWGQLYGPVVYFQVLHSKLVILNTYTAARELLDQRGAIYSCRPYVPMAGDVVGWGWALALLPYGETWKRHRKYIQTYFSRARLPSYYPLQTREAHRAMNDLYRDGDDFDRHIQRMIGATVLSIVYGYDAKTNDDWMLKVLADGAETLVAGGSLGAHIVDLFPILRHIPDWLPGAGFKRLPPGTREKLKAMRMVPFSYCKDQMLSGDLPQCYVSDLLEGSAARDEEGVIDTAAILYSAAFDSTYAVLITAIMALTKFTHVQDKLQAELDAVVGRERLPDYSDNDKLPYLISVVLETIRWGSVVPVGVPHRVTQDDYYNGVFIPKGSTVLANSWAMFNDPAVYENPRLFDPDRFMVKPGETAPPDPRGSVFGFGRRRCPGEDYAQNTIFIAIACFFHALRFTAKKDEDGKEIPIDDKLTDAGTVLHPQPFLCDIKPRFDGAESLINAVRED